MSEDNMVPGILFCFALIFVMLLGGMFHAAYLQDIGTAETERISQKVDMLSRQPVRLIGCKLISGDSTKYEIIWAEQQISFRNYIPVDQVRFRQIGQNPYVIFHLQLKPDEMHPMDINTLKQFNPNLDSSFVSSHLSYAEVYLLNSDLRALGLATE